MDSAVVLSPKSAEPRSGGPPSPCGEKRGAPDGDPGDSAGGTAKRPRLERADLGRVAEIVLVLAAMGRMRGGRDPTEAELGLMAEAREKLALMCETLAPKDIVAGDAIGRVIEDLGLNAKAKDQRLGFTVPKLTIAEKLSFAKRKMEESKKFPPQTASYSSHSLQPSFSSTAENRGISSGVRTLPSDKANQSPIPSGVMPVSSPPANVPTGNSTSLPYQLRTSTVSSGMSNSHLGRDSAAMLLPRVDQVQGTNNPAPHLSTRASHATYVNQPSVNAPSWSLQTQPASASRLGTENNMPNHTLGQIERMSTEGSSVTSLAVRDPTSRSFVPQTAAARLPTIHHPPLPGVNFAPSNYSSHYEIAKVVQKFLPPKLPEHPTWTPPSREYMNKAVICQICQITINDVESVLLCDACEKGYHLKCLQSQNQKAIPKAEWHCQKCLALSHGKALPPKYGRVMRNLGASKVASNTAGLQSHIEKKIGAADMKANQPKVTSNGIASSQNPVMNVTGKDHSKSVSDLQRPKTTEMHKNALCSSKKEIDQKPFPEAGMNSLGKSTVSTCSAPPGLLLDRSTETKKKSELSSHHQRAACELKSELCALGASANDECSQPLSSCNMSNVNLSEQPTIEVPVKAISENDVAMKEVDKAGTENQQADKAGKEGHLDSTSRSDIKREHQDIRQPQSVPTSERSAGKQECAGFSSDFSHSVEWKSDMVEVVNGKTFYASCCIGGVSYKVKEYVLFRLSNDKLTPFKLQAMWEDNRTGLKWMDISRCYFPGDLPNNVAHPFAPDNNEVFESNHNSSVMAGLIQGPCEVLPPAKYKEESERRRHAGSEANAGMRLRPLFLCNWFYDEVKGHFQAVSI